MTTQNAITWPEKYLPGTGDNFVSDEVIVRGPAANVADISFPQCGGPELKSDTVFSFGTFGFPPLDTRLTEFQHPAQGVPGRPMRNGHEAWLNGLVRAASGKADR
ncbi:hypothetical protein [Streptomyces sp. NPDC055189]